MYNSDSPLRAELPSSRQLLRSTLFAAALALVLLVVAVLPAEYGIDPTGLGGVLRLTGMGETKRRLSAEAASEAVASVAAAASQTAVPPLVMTSAPPVQPQAAAVVAPAPGAAWRDEKPFTLAPGEGTEYKVRMAKGARTQYRWVVEGGSVNFDAHGDAPGQSISYEKGRGVSSDEGELTAAFAGHHGWFFRNRGSTSVKVVLRTRGQYSELVRVK